jgi:hypothetical protein
MPRVDASLTARRVLAKAAVQLGGVAQLAARLNVGARLLGEYLTGARTIPDALFLAAIDIVLEELPEPRNTPRAGAPPDRKSAP